MATIYLRPDLRTSGGEIQDILLNGRYAGNMSLVFRENDRIGGAVQLDRSALSEEDQERVISFVQDYIQEMIYAVRAVDCDVVVTSGGYERVIATRRDEAGRRKTVGDGVEPSREALFERAAESGGPRRSALGDGAAAGRSVVGHAGGGGSGADVFDPEDDGTLGDEDAEHLDPLEMEETKAAYYELVVVGESRGRVDYHVYDEENRFVAEAEFRTRGHDGFGEIRFRFLPGEDEIEAVTDLIVSDFDEDEIDTFDIRVLHKGQELERIELAHEDLENGPADAASERDRSGRRDDLDGRSGRIGKADRSGRGGRTDGEELAEAAGRGGRYIVTLARDDGDMLTYEIFDHHRGGPPIGTATVDISQRELTGFIEFSDPVGEDVREEAAIELMRELDKEKDYRSINLSVMCGNEKVDELMFEEEPVH